MKAFNIISKGLHAAPVVILISDETMCIESFWSNKVEGLSHDTSPSGCCYIASCRTRNGNDAFYQWYIHTVVLPYIDACRLASGVENTPLLFTLDGEEVQIRNFMTATNLSEFKQRNTAIHKGGASISESGNALDAGDAHRGKK